MSGPRVSVELAGGDQILRGSTVSGVVRIDAEERVKIRNAKLQLRWKTSGKGNTDKSTVVDTQIHAGPELSQGVTEIPIEFEAPLAPLTYQGRLIKIEWQLRVRLDRPMVFDTKHDHSVYLM